MALRVIFYFVICIYSNSNPWRTFNTGIWMFNAAAIKQRYHTPDPSCTSPVHKQKLPPVPGWQALSVPATHHTEKWLLQTVWMMLFFTYTIFSLAMKLSWSQGTTGGDYLPPSASMHDNNEKLTSTFPKEQPTDAETGWEKLESWRKPWKETAFQENIVPNPCPHFLRNAKKTKSLNLSSSRPVWEWGEVPRVSVTRCLPLS